MQRKIRVLVGKPGLDGHDRGATVVAAALRDAGMEVIYTGLHQTPEQIVEAAIQEDVDVVALSILSGAHMTLFPEVLELLHSRGVGDKLLTGGGIIPAEDMETLARQGVGRLFGPGASTLDIVAYIREWFGSKHGADSLTPLPASFGRATAAQSAPIPAKQHRAAHAPAPKPRAAPSRRVAKPAPSRRVAKPARARAVPSAKPKSARRAAGGGAAKPVRRRRAKSSARRSASARG
jgi:methylmalonyl-CoA mutase C-terminal domain/subunit